MPKAATLSDPTNSKLGFLIHSWSVPAGRKFGCPGETSLCRTRCYAKRGFFHMPSVKESHLRNWNFSKTDGFIDWMVAQLHASFVRVMRIHVSGDFYSYEYTRKWIEIARRCRNVRFFAYTRSWREEEIFPELVKLAGFDNFQMWWSIDRETGPAPLIRGVRRAYMAIDDTDAELAPDDCDLVFRDSPQTVMKKANGIQVCPPENGVKTKHKLTCSNCGICWNKKSAAWEDTILPYIEQAGIEINAPAAA